MAQFILNQHLLGLTQRSYFLKQMIQIRHDLGLYICQITSSTTVVYVTVEDIFISLVNSADFKHHKHISNIGGRI